MATRKNATSKLTLKVITDVSEAGAKVYGQRTVSHLNPALTDGDVLSIGTGLSTLQEYELDSVTRTDVAEIAAE